MRVALCQIDTTPGDVRGNCTKILEWYRRALALEADMVVVPELAVCGYPPRDLLEQPAFLAEVERGLAHLTAGAGKAPLVVGAPVANPQGNAKPLHNAALVLRHGETLAVVRKKLLPTYDVFEETRHFAPDPEPAVPVDIDGVRWGIHVCEDAWNEEAYWREERTYSRDPVAELKNAGAEVLLNISASPFHCTKNWERLSMLQSHVQHLGIPLLYTNAVGGNDALIFDGESFALDPQGRVIAGGVPFVEEMLLVDVDSGRLAAAGRWTPESKEPEDIQPWRSMRPVQAVHDALVLGIRGYFRKCGFKSALIGLSGGIDSAVTAALAAHALGPENVWGVGLPSRYSSQGSVDDARALADLLGIRFDVLSIEPVYQASLDLLEGLFAGTEAGLAEENLQARARGLLLMGLSNKFGHLLLSTGNKSEMATGYSTLYGDMAGGLAVLSDVPKTMVYTLARWMNESSPTIPENSITKPPSAELRPDQTDQDSLPSYAILDDIMEGFLEDDLTRDNLVALGHSPEDVEQVLTLLSRAEYKRRQAPPGLRISPKAFGLGRRLPIATPWRGFPEQWERD